MQISNIDLDALILQSGATHRTPPEQTMPGSTGAPPTSKPAPAEPKSVDKAIETINKALVLEQRVVRVVARADAKGPVIEVIDRETQKVVRQIPSDRVLKLAAWFEENGMLSGSSPEGLAFDETA